MAFPQTPLDLKAEMQIGGTWTDVTADLYARSPLTIERGRPDEAARVDPTRVSFQLDNRQNKYSPRTPSSPNYGLIGRNTPVRFSVPGPESYLTIDGGTANTTQTVDHASFAVTDLDVRAEMTMGWYSTVLNQTIMGQWGSDGNRGWIWRIYNGFSTLNWTTSGAIASGVFTSVTLPVLPRRAALRMTMDVDNGAGGWTFSLYQATDLGAAWTLVGSTTGVGTTSIFNSSAPLQIAPSQSDTNPPRMPFAGRGHRFELRASIGGANVAAPDFRALPPGAASFADSAGRTWTFSGTASVNDREYRAVAEMSSWPPRWDESGHDVYVPAEAAGIMRRLGQGAKPLASTLRRRIPRVGNPVAYWPMEEGRIATQAYSPVTGVAPLVTTGFEYAADNSLLGSDALPRLSAAASMSGGVPPYTSTGSWMVAMVFNWPTAPASDTILMEFTTSGSATRIRLTGQPAGVFFEGLTASGSTLFSAGLLTGGTDFYGVWNRLEITAITSGGNVDYRVGWSNVSGSGWGDVVTVAATAGTVTTIATAFGTLAADVRLGHLGVFPSGATTVYDGADDGYLGEGASVRMARLCSEEGVPLSAERAETALGSQIPDTLLALLGKAEAADLGVLSEDREALGLRYRARTSFYNQPVALTLDYATAGHVAPPLEPVDDDQRVRNDRTVVRDGGTSARAVDATSPLSTQSPPNGVGVYDDSRTLSLGYDSQPADIAAWLLHVGTWDEARYPTVHIDLAAAPSLIPAVLELEIGDRIQIINPPTWLPPGPIDLLVEGYTEVIGHPNSWDIVLNCSPAGPWTVGVYDDTNTGLADTDGSVLGAAATSSATQLLVATVQTELGVPRWTEAAGDYPMDLRVGGEVVTASAATPFATDVFTRSVSAGWGTSTSGHAWTNVGGFAADRSVASNRGTLTLASAPTTIRHQLLAGACGDAEFRCAVAVSATATGAALLPSVLMRYQSTSLHYRLRVHFNTAGTVSLSVTSGTTQIGSTVVTGLTYAAGDQIQLRVRLIDHRVLAKAWGTGTGINEPASWTIDRTVDAGSGQLTSGQLGLSASGDTGNTNVSPEFRYDDLTVLSPQRMTVTRAVNGISKAQMAGADIRLATPPIYAL